MPLLAKIAFTHIRARLRQTVLSVLGVTTGVGFAVAMAALMQGSQEDFIQRIIDASPHVVVKDEYRNPPSQPVATAFADGAVAISGVKPKEELRGIRNPKPRLVLLEAMPGVAAAPTLRGQVVVRYGGKDVAVNLVGIDPKREGRVSNLEADMVEGSLIDLFTSANGVIIGSGVARKLAAERGASVVISSPAGIRLRAKVVGIFHSGLVGIDNATIYARLKEVQVILDRPNVVNEIRLRLEDVTRARAVADQIERRLGYWTESWEESNESILETFVIRNIIIYTVVAGILLVAGFGIFNIISTVTYEKIRDIAILKSIGFAERDLRRIFVLEAAVIGSAGTLAGWLLGYALCLVLENVVITRPGFSEAAGLPVTYDPWHYAISAACALSSATIAGYLPARRAARVDPVEIIRGAA
jgi:lipoprotein-releasing system permease protein